MQISLLAIVCANDGGSECDDETEGVCKLLVGEWIEESFLHDIKSDV